MKRQTIEAILAAQRERRPVALITDLASGHQTLVPDPATDDSANDSLPDFVAQALATDRARIETTAEGRSFVQPFCPPPRLAIVGAVHIAQHLAPLATGLGHDVTVIDPRSAFATPKRFPGIELHAAWPDEAIDAIGLDGRSALVTLSHDPKIDDPALARGLASNAYYIGCLGSRRTQARRQARLRELGFHAADLERLHGPVGLDIGARSPAEIALAIAAEITLRLRKTDE